MTTHWTHKTTAARPLPMSESMINQLIVGASTQMQKLKRLIATVAVSDAPVMVLGETGAGKELVAEAVHRASGRSGNLIAVNCAAIPSELLESELFGHEKGAFTGADKQRIGLIEQASGGTLFLDEIGDMPAALQTKLLRVLETRRVQRVGASVAVPVDFRLVTATHRNLEARVVEGSFRADLFYRINVFPILLPSLAERAVDIPAILARMISDRMAENPALDAPHFDQSALRALAAHPWPGNVRELRNVLARAFVLFPGRIVTARHVRDNLLALNLPDAEDAPQPEAPSPEEHGLPEASSFHDALQQKGDLDIRGYLRDIEVALIEAALDKRDGCVTQAADALRLRRTTLIEKMKKYGIRRGALI
jgi:sigma-54 dependent transcriptional regulator, flagellar regulatory protein